MEREQIIKAWEDEAAVGKEVGLRRDFIDQVIISLVNDTLALIKSQEQRIKELTEENESLKTRYVSADNLIIAETVRKMQERLTLEFDRMHKNNFMTPEVRQWIIDQIAKEMLEGK